MQELANVYGRSLFEVALDAGKLDVVRDQLGEFCDFIRDRQDLQLFFFSPYFSTEEKTTGLSRMVEGADPVLMNFLNLLIEKYRVPAIFRIREHYNSLWKAHNRRLPVEIISAVELDRATIEHIGEQISTQTSRKVELSTEVRSDILGGIVVRVGNSILDASIRNRLDQLRKQVARAA